MVDELLVTYLGQLLERHRAQRSQSLAKRRADPGAGHEPRDKEREKLMPLQCGPSRRAPSQGWADSAPVG